jgi:uncharacterized protein YbcV (DUF1398 family)
MNTDTIAECMHLSFADTPFPNVVERLVGAGVNSYTADLIKLRNTYYGANGEAYDEALPLQDGPQIAPAFDQPAVTASIKAIQKGELGYAEFLRRIMRSGCAHYEVFIAGRKVMYFGRDGDFYTEHFPAGK